jgi:phospholipid transport system substrate-binding protein
MPDMYRLFAVWLGILMLAAVPALAADKGAEAVVRQTTERIYRAIEKDRPLVSQQPEHLYRLVERILLPHADLERMSRWVLGRFWRQSSENQRHQFTQEFTTLLVRTYSTAIESASPEDIRYLPSRDSGHINKAVIRTEVQRAGEATVPIDYYMHNKEGRWLVYDIRVEGISLVTNYRSTFAREFSLKGLQGLIDALKQQNEQPVASND